ncbi:MULTISPECIES: phosphotransferase family protein [unclassified Streptosporangium]|uniref:phosphotransferase family protein n=1 Tax=unclassified Streptosporangium TaxID=2632669 RepID=UPI002E2CADB3|nr:MULTISPECIES: phosphotransferase [unclassified Streptosporangium]
MRPQWDDLPSNVRDAVEQRIGQVLKADPVTKGLMPGLAARLHTEDGGTVFLKAVSIASPAASLYARERQAGAVLPLGLPAPHLLWNGEVEGWIVLLHEYVDGRDADLSPGSPDVPLVLDILTVLNEALTPCPGRGDVPDVAANVAMLQAKAARLLALPAEELPHRAMYETALGKLSPDALDGDTLLHYDLHAGNFRIDDGRAYAIDWAFAVRGAAWVDAVMLAPRFIEAGHTPEQTEALLVRVPAWRSAPANAVTALAALWTLFRLYKARFGPVEGRDFRARAAEAGRAWLHHRMGERGPFQTVITTPAKAIPTWPPYSAKPSSARPGPPPASANATGGSPAGSVNAKPSSRSPAPC